MILADGPHVVVKINDVTTAELFDEDAQARPAGGKIVLCAGRDLGESVTAQFKDVRLRRLTSSNVKPSINPQTPTAGQRWTNSLGMVFVPVPGTGALFGIWDTRVMDFEAFVRETGYDAAVGMLSLRRDGWKQRGDSWKNPGFSQGPSHPVVGVNWTDAKAFCQWLTAKERSARSIGSAQSYRLPTDAEWSTAVGLNESSAGIPKDKQRFNPGIYPWGSQWPPPAGAGNYAGNEANDDTWPSNTKTIPGYQDSYPRTSPVASFQPNRFGLYDMGGNLWQWCEDWYDGEQRYRVLRGASWGDCEPADLLSAARHHGSPGLRGGGLGFRCVMEGVGAWR